MKSTAPGTIATVDYKFPKPGTTEYVAKQSYVTRVGDRAARLLQIAANSCRNCLRRADLPHSGDAVAKR